jgi:hypothetical protein
VEHTGGRRLRPHDYHPGDEKRCAHAGQNRCSARIARENLAWRRRQLVCSWRARHLEQHWPMMVQSWRQRQVVGSPPAYTPGLLPLLRGRRGGGGRAPAPRLHCSRQPQERGRRAGGGRRNALKVVLLTVRTAVLPCCHPLPG